MKNNLKYFLVAAVLIFAISNCKKEKHSMGDLTAPTNIVVATEVIGQDATHPDGDGSGLVKISISADNALAYRIDYDSAGGIAPEALTAPTLTKKFAKNGVNTYFMTIVVYGKGATASTVTKEVTVRSDFSPTPEIIANLTGGSSKTWVVDKSVAGHLGVGPWEVTSVTPAWWSAGVNEKVACCPCFYSATFKFNKLANGYSIDVATPEGAFTKTGDLAGGLPGIPASGDEGCYSYAGGSSSFSFIEATSGIPVATPTTKTSIQLAGNNTFIGYGAVLKEYEILVITDTYLYLRVQGTETGNAWYLKLKAL